jgi:organic radical activating enzyme
MSKLFFEKVEIGFHSNPRFHNVPAIILTVSGCNLKCISDNDPNVACPYSFVNETYNLNYAKKIIKANKQIRHIVFRGGEALMYKEEMENLLCEVWRDNMIITIYTNGTLPILNPLGKKFHISLYVVDLGIKKTPKAGDKVINPVNGKEFVFGTNDVEKVNNNVNIENIRNICLYSKDYLLVFKASPKYIEQYSEIILKRICETDDENLNMFLEKYSPYNHVVYGTKSEDKDEIFLIQKLCLEKGIYYYN